MNSPAKKPSPTLEDATDQELLEECDLRGCGPPEKGIEDFSDEEIKDEYEERFEMYSAIMPEQIYEELYRLRLDVPQILRDYLYDKTGRTLP